MRGGGSRWRDMRGRGVGEDGHATHLCSTVNLIVTWFQFPLILQQREQANIVNDNIATVILPTLRTDLKAGDNITCYGHATHL